MAIIFHYLLQIILLGKFNFAIKRDCQSTDSVVRFTSGNLILKIFQLFRLSYLSTSELLGICTYIKIIKILLLLLLCRLDSVKLLLSLLLLNWILLKNQQAIFTIQY